MADSNIAGWLGIMSAMLFFKATTYMETFEGYIKDYPTIIALIAVTLFFYRKPIEKKLSGGKKNG